MNFNFCRKLFSKIFPVTFFSLLIIFSLTACDCKADFSLNENDGLSVEFNGTVGNAMISLFDLNGNDDSIFDEQEISSQLLKSGFSDVKVYASQSKIKIFMKDKNLSSVLFSSGLVELQEKNGKKNLKTHLNADALKKFYDAADEDLCSLLDLFLAPVFNDESMTPFEYVEMVETVYGKDVGKEISESEVLISGIAEKSQTYKLAEILCGTAEVK